MCISTYDVGTRVRFNPSVKFGQALLLKIELGWGENYQTTIPSNLPLQLFFMLMASCEWSATISLFGWPKAKVTIKSAETFGPLVKHASCLPWVPECPAIRDFHWDAHLLSRGSTHSATSKGAQCILGTGREETSSSVHHGDEQLHWASYQLMAH